MFLVVVTRAAFAITDGDDEFGVIASRTLSVSATILVALGLVLLRLGLAVWVSWQAARLTSTVVAETRRELAGHSSPHRGPSNSVIGRDSSRSC